MKLKKLAKQCLKTFRLSEDYDSDSDVSDEDNKLYKKGTKHIAKLLKKSSVF